MVASSTLHPTCILLSSLHFSFSMPSLFFFSTLLLFHLQFCFVNTPQARQTRDSRSQGATTTESRVWPVFPPFRSSFSPIFLEFVPISKFCPDYSTNFHNSLRAASKFAPRKRHYFRSIEGSSFFVVFWFIKADL